MHQAITSAQIAHWFTVGVQFANITITDEVKKEAEAPATADSSVEQLSEQTSPEKAGSDGGNQKSRRPELPTSPGTTPPSLGSYEYPILPITKNRQELVSLIENNSVIIIRGATGSGKTTQLPQFILDHYAEKKTPCNLVVTQPRKIGATSIARWVARERKCTLGSLVGYQVGLEKMATEHTKLIYVTTGVLLQKLVSSKTLTEYSHIFIDEVHERTEELDFLLLVVRKLLRTNSRYVKVILMSATINCAEFAEYFGTPIRNQMNPAYVFEVEGAPYAIEEFYLDELKTILPLGINVDLTFPVDPCITEEMYNVAVSLIQSFDEMEQTGSATHPERGSVLVFLPGLAEIQYMKEALAKLVRKRLQVYPLHSTVTLEEQNGVFLVPVPGYRKIILSTNIAESSVTVPDVKYVIDFCLVRQLVCDKETNYRCLRITWASKTSCNQRRGRAGRVSKGFCYRLVSRHFWEHEIPDFTIPEMLRSPLASTLLKVKLLDMGDPRSVLSTALTPPNLNDIERTVLQLKQIGALSVQSNSQRQFDGELTFLGRVLAHLPVDLQLGKLIVFGHVFGCLEECLIIAASLSLKSFFAMPSLQQLAGYRSKLSFAQNVPSDLIAFVNAFKAWYTSRAKGELRHPKDELEWGKENCIQIKRIREVAELFEDLKKRVSKFNMHISSSSNPTDYTSLHKQRFILQVAIAGAFFPNYFSQGEIDEQLASKELSGNDPKTTIMVPVNLPPFAFLCYKQLQSLFRQCGQVKSIFLTQHIKIQIFFSWNIKRTGFSNKNLSFRVNVDVQSHAVSPVGVLSSTVNPEKLPSTVCRSLMCIIVLKVIDVGHFWGFRTDESSVEKQCQLTAALNIRDLRPVSVSLYPNLLCVAPFKDGQQMAKYYRAKVLHILGSNVEVFYVDFGNTSVVPCSSLRELPSDLMTPPFQAQEFCIAGMGPSAHSLILGGRWSSRARNRFKTLTSGRSAIVSLYSILHGVMRVDLHISMEAGDVSVADLLVQEGHACHIPESFESQQSHEVLISLYEDMASGRFTPSSTSGSLNSRMEEDKLLINELLQHFCASSSSAPKKFHTSCTPGKDGGKDGINSVMVNESPQNWHERMLVAATVSLSASGSRILLKETSLMPHIHGLPSIITMLFTPVMELRTNEDRTCFTGALCGLGWNSVSQNAVLPEHDIELAFDVKFEIEDITEINALRGTVNKLVCDGPNGLTNLSPEKISSLQEEARERLVGLFIKNPPRPECTPVYYEKFKKWNQLQEKDDGKSKGVLFQLHPITLLNM
uniref:ATP-dependent RNA helicase TDRD9 n=1 Tax=Cyprinus carpio carpio TaxID=630221 RepID=A0A8C1EWJ5_CYPCA